MIPVILAGVTYLLFEPAFAEGRTLWLRDNVANHIPNTIYWFDRVRAGEFPAWNPYSSGGMPFASDPVQGTFYPLKFLMLLAGDPVTGFNWLHALHLFLFAWGVDRLGKSWGMAPAGRLMATLTVMLCGSIVFNTRQMQFLFALTWLPWLLIAAGNFARSAFRSAEARRSGMWIVVLGALMLLASEPQTFIVSWGMLLIFWLCVPVGGTLNGGARIWRALVSCTELGVLAIGVSLIQWIPAAILASESNRAVQGLSLAAAEECSVHPLRFVEFFIPRLFGDDVGVQTIWSPKLACSGANGTFYYGSAYVGAAALALGVAGIWSAGAKRFRLFLVLMVLTALWLAMGSYAPLDLYSLFFRIVPAWNRFRFPERMLPWAGLGLALLAGFGLDSLMSASRRMTGAFVAVAVMAAAALALVWFVPWVALLEGFDPAYRPWADVVIRSALLHGRYSILCTVAVLVAAWSADRRKLLWLIPVCVLIDVGINAAHIVSFADSPDFLRKPPALVEVTRSLFRDAAPAPVRYAPPAVMVVAARSGVTDPVVAIPARVEGLGLDVGIGFGLSAVRTGNTLISARMETMISALEPDRFELLHGAQFGVAWPQFPLPDRSYDLVSKVGQVDLYRSKQNPSRVICPSEWIALPDGPESVARIAGADRGVSFRVDESVVGPFPESGMRADPASARCRVTGWSPERFEIEADLPDNGPVVLRELYSRGWSARDESGRLLPVVPANHLHQGVVPGPGRHRITFEYRLPGLVPGAVLSAVSLLLALWLGFAPQKGQAKPAF